MSENIYNPKDRIKHHLKRKSSSRVVDSPRMPSSAAEIRFVTMNSESCPVPIASNPFKASSPPRKRRQTQVKFIDSEENAQDSFSANILRFQINSEETNNKNASILSELHGVGKRDTELEKDQPNRFKNLDSKFIQEFHAVDFSHLFDRTFNEKPVALLSEEEQSEEIPLDLRIGSKLRIVSKSPFSWMSTRKTTGIVSVRIPASERFKGMTYFNELYLTGLENPTTPVPTSCLSVLEAASLYWQFPVIPGMALYPRITSELKSVDRVPLTTVATDRLTEQWTECFEQLFMSFKKNERESFYVACAVFNVLFTKTNISDEVEINEESQSCFRSFSGQKLVALVSHTVSSTREHLRSQGVNYEVINAKPMKKMPSFSSINNSQSCSLSGFESKESTGDHDNSSKLSRSDNDSSDENDSPTKANQKWLDDIGVSPRQLKSSKRKLATTMADQDGISCLLVKGSAVQSLYNMLMSSDFVHEKTGPYTKVPPTLISPAPFLYGQLLSLNSMRGDRLPWI
uniref:Uncharacterized protein n=1 Tax=Caenorhabditis japonica TaxID=281687 RepID=A0A8R1E0A0_CAEJA